MHGRNRLLVWNGEKSQKTNMTNGGIIIRRWIHPDNGIKFHLQRNSAIIS